MDKIKLHARVTKEIEVTQEQAERLINHLCGCVEHTDISDITELFMENAAAGDYEAGYIPISWLVSDLENSALYDEAKEYLNENQCNYDDIEL